MTLTQIGTRESAPQDAHMSCSPSSQVELHLTGKEDIHFVALAVLIEKDIPFVADSDGVFAAAGVNGHPPPPNPPTIAYTWDKRLIYSDMIIAPYQSKIVKSPGWRQTLPARCGGSGW